MTVIRGVARDVTGTGQPGRRVKASMVAASSNPGEDLAAVVSSLITALSTLGLIDDQTTT